MAAASSSAAVPVVAAAAVQKKSAMNHLRAEMKKDKTRNGQPLSKEARAQLDAQLHQYADTLNPRYAAELRNLPSSAPSTLTLTLRR